MSFQKNACLVGAMARQGVLSRAVLLLGCVALLRYIGGAEVVLDAASLQGGTSQGEVRNLPWLVQTGIWNLCHVLVRILLSRCNKCCHERSEATIIAAYLAGGDSGPITSFLSHYHRRHRHHRHDRQHRHSHRHPHPQIMDIISL